MEDNRMVITQAELTEASKSRPMDAQVTDARLTVAGVLDQYVPLFVSQNVHPIGPHSLNILARLSLCRTASMGRRQYKCQSDQCDGIAAVFNSCGERNCPRCQGARRQDWLDKMAETIIPRIDYFQIVLTMTDKFSDLILANPAKLYGLLMRSAWKAIKGLLKELGISSGATILLHTWNQRLFHHPHVHVLLPAGGPSLDGKSWVTIGEKERDFLQQRLGKRFRDLFVKGIARLQRRGELKLNGALSIYDSLAAMAAWLKPMFPGGFRVFVQAPPKATSTPKHVLNYLARYTSGGPIFDHRLVSDSDGMVTFKARTIEKPAPGEPHEKELITIPGVEFARRWAIHILPKQFFRVRHYGGLSNPHRVKYLAHCRELLGVVEEPEETKEPEPTKPDVDTPEGLAEAIAEAPVYQCPKCQQAMTCIEMSSRPSWAKTMNGGHRPAWYPRTRTVAPVSSPVPARAPP